MYTCARCGEDSITKLIETEQEDDSYLVEGWCDNCDDYRPIED